MAYHLITAKPLYVIMLEYLLIGSLEIIYSELLIKIIEENAFENACSKLASISSLPQCWLICVIWFHKYQWSNPERHGWSRLIPRSDMIGFAICMPLVMCYWVCSSKTVNLYVMWLISHAYTTDQGESMPPFFGLYCESVFLLRVNPFHVVSPIPR